MSAQGGKPRQITFGSGHSRPSWSHDGRWIYSTGNGGIQKTPAAGGGPMQLSKLGTNPVESVDGKAVFYRQNREIRKVGVDGEGGSVVVNDAALSGLAVTADGVYYFGDGVDAGVRLYRFSEEPTLSRRRRRRWVLTRSPYRPTRSGSFMCSGTGQRQEI